MIHNRAGANAHLIVQTIADRLNGGKGRQTLFRTPLWIRQALPKAGFLAFSFTRQRFKMKAYPNKECYNIRKRSPWYPQMSQAFYHLWE
jgi:hypothetical protein